MRTLLTAVLAAAILAVAGPVVSTASAAEGALAPGKPAGVQKIQLVTTPLIIVGVVAAAAVAIGISSAKSATTTGIAVNTAP